MFYIKKCPFVGQLIILMEYSDVYDQEIPEEVILEKIVWEVRWDAIGARYKLWMKR